MATKLHFWRRVEGAVGREHLEPGPIAKLDDGRYVRYHFATASFYGASDLLRRSLWHWEYLGAGELWTIDGVVQFPKERRTGTEVRS